MTDDAAPHDRSPDQTAETARGSVPEGSIRDGPSGSARDRSPGAAPDAALASVPDRPPDRARIALAFGAVMGVLIAWGLARESPDLLMLNLEVYYYAAGAVLEGRAGDLYAVAPPDHPIYRFVYPPAVVGVFLPYGLASSPTVPFLVHTAGQVAAGLALAWLLVRETERHGVALGRGDRALVAAFVLVSIHTVPSLYYGNVNLSLSLLVAAGLAYTDRRPRLAGVALAVPAVVKVFPAAAGVWWLRDRAPRPPVVATLACGAVGVASLAAFGVDLHRTYVRSAVLDRLDPALYEGGIDPGAAVVTVRRPVSILLPSAPSWAVTAGAALVLAPVVAVAYLRFDPVAVRTRTDDPVAAVRARVGAPVAALRTGDSAALLGRFEDPVDRLVAVYVTVTAVLLFFPSYFVYLVYLYYPLVPLLYLLDGRTGQLFAAGAVVTSLAFTPETTMEYLAVLPDAATATVRPAVEFASLSLLGLGITIVACLHHRFAGASRSGPPATDR